MEKDTVTRVFSEDEVYAVVAAKVESAVEERDATIADLRAALEVAGAAAATAKQEAEAAAQELAEFKAEIEEAKRLAETAATRVAEYKAAAPHLGDDYFTEERVESLAVMPERAFAEVLAAVATAPKPVETAMSGEDIAPKKETISVAGFLRDMKKGK